MSSRSDSRQPRVLYLSFFFPPSRASGVYRLRATANYLVNNGWDVTAYAAPLSFLNNVLGSVDESLATTVDPRIHVERPSLRVFPWERDLRQFSRFRAHFPTVARKAYRWGQENIFPEPYRSWGSSALAHALRAHSRRRFDVVLATGNPYSAFAAAYMFNRLTGVPYVLDYRDSWTLDVFADAPAYPPAHPSWAWEKRAIGRAGGIAFVNEALRDWHARQYPASADRMMVVPNGWDADVLDPAGGSTPASHRGPLRFSYLGTVTNSQPVEEMATAFRMARKNPDLSDAQLNVYGHLGFFRHSAGSVLQRLGLEPTPGWGPSDPLSDAESGIHLRGPVSKTQVAKVYDDSDVLVFLAGGSKYVTSGKIFEYMATGRPIVSVHAPGIAAREILRTYPLWFTADSLDPAEIADTMVAAGHAARSMTPQQRAAAQAAAQAFNREAVLQPLEQRLRELAEGRGQR
jgi:glycosyltransferase involved in cell wall biosynthesis